MNWKAPAGCVAAAAALATVAGVLAAAQAFQPAVKPVLFAALLLIGVGAVILIGGVLLSAFSFLRGVSVLPKRKPKPQPTPVITEPLEPTTAQLQAATVAAAVKHLDNSALIRTLQHLQDIGQAILVDVSAAGAVFSRVTADQAWRWYQDVAGALDATQRQRFINAAGPFRSSTPGTLMNSLDACLHALGQIISELRPKPPAHDFHSSP